ncbi:MAG: MFS transporter [Candidatus Omnitrophota bacterium]
MSKFTEVLKRRDFFFLWLGQIISQLGDRLNQMALIAFIYLRAPGSSIEIAKMLSFTIIPVFLIGPLAGVYVDRWDRRRTMFICDFLRAGLVLTIPAFLFYAKSLIPIYIVIFIVFCISRFFVPAKLAIIPDLVEPKDLLIANSLVNITGMIAAILGFGVSGIVVDWLGARSGFFLDAFSFLVSGSLIFFISRRAFVAVGSKAKHIDRQGIKKVSREIVAVINKSVFQEIKEGVLYFLKNKDIRFTAGIIFILWSALGAVYAVSIAFVQRTLQSVTKDLGLLAMLLGLGLFLGSLVYGRFGQRLSHYKTIFMSLVLSGIMLVAFAFGISHFPNFFVAAGLSLLLGMAIAPIMIASNTIIHNASSNDMMGKIFSSLEIVMHLGFIIFMFISSFLAERFSHSIILISVGCVVIISGIVNLIYHRKIPWLD